jgi:hypothetical protein
MCNAWNHPPGCNCGWGGVWYGSYGSSDAADEHSWVFSRSPPPRKLGLQIGTQNKLSGGYTNPNARCPVCNEPVFYYESPYGGRVFFDSLGPPWPKHPCTSSDQNEYVGYSRKKSSWQEENWMPLTEVSINHKTSEKLIYTITGKERWKRFQFYFLAHEIVMAEIVRFRKHDSGQFEFSILDFNAIENEWAVWSGLAFTDSSKINRSQHAFRREVVHAHFGLKQAQSLANQAEKTKKPFKCDICGDVLFTENSLPMHLKGKHGILLLEVNNNITGRMLTSIDL